MGLAMEDFKARAKTVLRYDMAIVKKQKKTIMRGEAR
jgi:hypothetical protein